MEVEKGIIRAGDNPFYLIIVLDVNLLPVLFYIPSTW